MGDRDAGMSIRDRLLIAIGVVAVGATVVIPMGHRLISDRAAVGVGPIASPSPSSPGTPSGAVAVLPTVEPYRVALWQAQAAFRRGDIGTLAEYQCPPDGWPFVIWGTDAYTDDSSVCTAAVHAGLITFAAGGTVTIVVSEGRATYEGTTRNGVTSESFEAWDGSFEFIRDDS